MLPLVESCEKVLARYLEHCQGSEYIYNLGSDIRAYYDVCRAAEVAIVSCPFEFDRLNTISRVSYFQTNQEKNALVAATIHENVP